MIRFIATGNSGLKIILIMHNTSTQWRSEGGEGGGGGGGAGDICPRAQGFRGAKIDN